MGMKVTYNGGTSDEVVQHVGTNPNFVFQTMPVTALLKDSADTPLAGAFQFRYGWGPWNVFTSPTESLPISMGMKVTYNAGTSSEVVQNVGTSPNFVFQTGAVTSANCTTYRFGWNAWVPFTSPMELLPVQFEFKNASGPSQFATPVVGTPIDVNCP